MPPTHRSAVLAGLGSALPPTALTNEELAERLGVTADWIESRTGIRERRVVAPGEATGDLAVLAGRRALSSARAAGIGDPDLVVLATTTPDHSCPATAPSVATRLGLGTVPAFDISAVCSGFVYALATAAGAIAAGLAERVLVVAAETFTTIVDPHDRTSAPLFGDGAGACVLRAGTADEPGALLAFDLGSDGTLSDAIIVRAGGSRQRSTGPAEAPEDHFFTMAGREVFQTAVRRMAEATTAAVHRTGWSLEDVDHLVGHQANARILHATAGRLGLPEDRAVVTLAATGNTAAASIPLALAEAARAGRFRTGQRLVLAAFGGGATWGAVTLTWPRLQPDTDT